MPNPLAVSIGDPSGIGPDIILASWIQREELGLPKFFVCGDAKFLKRRSVILGLDIKFQEIDKNDTGGFAKDRLPVVPLVNGFIGEPGTSSTEDAAGTIEAIRASVQMVHKNMASAVVTAPINKKNLYDAGFSHPGHTEFLAELSEEYFGEKSRPIMMLAGPDLKVVPVTIHIPLCEVPMALSKNLIEQTGLIVARDLKQKFGILNPRLAISGLNPHAGEGGAIGSEDEKIIRPAIEKLRQAGIDAIGPLPADTMFHPAARKQYDAALCMYHDQALIPAKTLAFDDSVNATLGLPFIRTSPDHGTAYDIAGTGKANPSSFIAALKMANMMVENAN